MGEWTKTSEMLPGHHNRVLIAINGVCDGKQIFRYTVGIYYPSEGRWYTDQDDGYDMSEFIVAWSNINALSPF